MSRLNATRLSSLKGKVKNVSKKYSIVYIAPRTPKTQRHSEHRELNQTRSKLDAVDRPVRTARTGVHHYNSTQYCSIVTVFFNIPIPPESRSTSHLRCGQVEKRRQDCGFSLNSPDSFTCTMPRVQQLRHRQHQRKLLSDAETVNWNDYKSRQQTKHGHTFLSSVRSRTESRSSTGTLARDRLAAPTTACTTSIRTSSSESCCRCCRCSTKSIRQL